MAVPGDFLYLRHLMDRREIAGPVLDLGSRNVQGGEWGNARHTCVRSGIEWEGADAQAGPDVTFTLDVLDARAVERVGRTWPTVIAMNLFEHVYDPVRGLQNMLKLTHAAGGSCIVVTPSVWEIHDYPGDYWRFLPDFWLEFAERNGCVLHEPRWIVGNRLVPWAELMNGTQKNLPGKVHGARIWGRRRHLWSRVAHRVLRTNGRELFFPYSGIGVMLRTGG